MSTNKAKIEALHQQFDAAIEKGDIKGALGYLKQAQVLMHQGDRASA